MYDRLKSQSSHWQLGYFHINCPFLHLLTLSALFHTLFKIKIWNKKFKFKNESIYPFRKFEESYLFLQRLVEGHFVFSLFSINQSIGMNRMRWFLAVLRSLLHSCLSYTFSCHSSPPTILPSSLTSSSHLFLGLPLGLIFFQIHVQYSFGNPIFFHSLYMSKQT